MKHITRLILFLFIYSCNNEGDIHIPIADTSATVTDSSTTAVDTAVKGNDTTRFIQKTISRKSANIAYSYFNIIKRNELKNIRAHLTINKPEAKTRDTLRQIERQQQVNSSNDDSSIINSLHIPLVYEDVEINLLGPAGDYTITKVGHNTDKQKIDTLNGNTWGWTVITKTDKPSTQLVLKITAYKPDASEELENRSIPIRIKLEQNIIRKLWAVLLDDPKYLLTVILVPVIGYFGKKYYDRKMASKSKDGSA
ncbi:MAG: hypothetical protein K2X48_04950 [Chitinophagaceae bacterium]|nr:hypothetical protein [Chitinophagaceae bacterium]